MYSNSNRFARLVRLALPVTLLAALVPTTSPAARSALVETRPVTVTIWDLEQTGGNFDTTTLGDFYAEITINGNEHQTSEIDFLNPFDGYIIPTSNLLPEPWVVTENVPADALSVPVHIEVWDSDLIDPDDQADINPGPKEAVDLEVDMATGKWTGDVNWPESCSAGNFDLDADKARICFDINTISVSGDIDEDGLLDNWEQKGIDLTQDGTIDIDLPAFGADPFRKDVFVEADCLVALDHTHCPRQDSIEDVVYAFGRAPVANLDGTTGVQLHVDVGPLYGSGAIAYAPGPGGVTGTYGDFGGGGDQIPEAGIEVIESFSAPKGNGLPFANLKQGFFDPVREPIFHYAVFAHQTNYRAATNDCTSGEASGIPGHDFMVTLGGSPFGVPTFPCWGADANGLSVGDRKEQAGTFMHELGHTLGLQHGGYESYTEDFPKPNYLSVMSYPFQMCDVPTSPDGRLLGGCNYSPFELPAPGVPLIEDNLDECIGIGANLFGPVDWDDDALLEGLTNCQPPNSSNVAADINGDGLKTVLGGYDDWKNLDYRTGLSGAGDGNGVPNEADPQTIEDARDQIGETMAPGVVVTKSGPATAVPGDVLNYTTEISNPGPGPALNAVLTDTAPDGSSQTEALGALFVGSLITRGSSFTVPADACPGDFTGASATVDFQDIVGNGLSASGSAPLEILDVTAPVLTLSVSPASLWPPDHKFQEITVAVTVTDNCDPDPDIILVSVTSNEPETGFLGLGDKGPDVQGADLGTDDRTISLRAERGTGLLSTGRVYTLTYRATDSSGNTSVATVTVLVPTSLGRIR